MGRLFHSRSLSQEEVSADYYVAHTHDMEEGMSDMLAQGFTAAHLPKTKRNKQIILECQKKKKKKFVRT